MISELTENMGKSGYPESIKNLAIKIVQELVKKNIKGTEKFIHRLMRNIDNKDEFLDVLMEGRIANVLAQSGMSDISIETKDEGPDFSIIFDGDTIYLEVLRKRPNNEDEIFGQPGAHFVRQTSTQNIISLIQGKLRQLTTDEINIVVICSDTVTMGVPNIEEALKYICQEINEDNNKYRKLSAIIFTESAQFPLTDIYQVYLFVNKYASKPLSDSAISKIGCLMSKT